MFLFTSHRPWCRPLSPVSWPLSFKVVISVCSFYLYSTFLPWDICVLLALRLYRVRKAHSPAALTILTTFLLISHMSSLWHFPFHQGTGKKSSGEWSNSNICIILEESPGFNPCLKALIQHLVILKGSGAFLSSHYARNYCSNLSNVSLVFLKTNFCSCHVWRYAPDDRLSDKTHKLQFIPSSHDNHNLKWWWEQW